MFKTYANHPEANYLVNIFSKVFNFTEFNEEASQNKEQDFCLTTYTAKTDDDWALIIEFYNSKNSNTDQKVYYPDIKFQQLGKRVRNFDEEQYKERKQKLKDIVELMDKKYNPNFERMITVLKLFVEKGIECGLFKSLAERKYKKVIKSHVGANHYSGILRLTDNNFGTVTFNNILQKGVTGYRGVTHFKKSYISVSIDYLAHSDNTIHPYFKIRLPYSESRKSTCVIPMTGDPVVYFMSTDEKLRRECIDKLPSVLMDETMLKEFFDQEFYKEMKTCISKTLKIDKSTLNGVTPEELKEYFVLVEMLKI
jgi:hypothetical protein